MAPAHRNEPAQVSWPFADFVRLGGAGGAGWPPVVGTAGFEPQVVVVEVDERLDELINVLSAAGLTARSTGREAELILTDEDAYDLVRDAVASLGIGLLRLERRRHSIADVFSSREASHVG